MVSLIFWRKRLAFVPVCLKSRLKTPLQITNITGTIFGCAGYAIVIGKSSQGLWQSIGVEDGWYASARGSFVIVAGLQ